LPDFEPDISVCQPREVASGNSNFLVARRRNRGKDFIVDDGICSHQLVEFETVVGSVAVEIVRNSGVEALSRIRSGVDGQFQVGI